MTQRRRKYAPRLPPQQRREPLLDAPLDVLADCQLQEPSIEAVAASAGIGKPVVYTAFGSRTELVEALLRREHERGLEQARDAMPDDLPKLGPTGAYGATGSAFLRAVR